MRLLTLKEQQEILTEILYTFDDFCTKHGLTYFIMSGTLLGAVRHNGFIPWDDDVDVMLPRDDYNKFERLIHSHAPAGYRAYSIKYSQGYYYPFIKFGKEGTILKEPFPYVPAICLSIDVFPIDGCPNDYDEAKTFTKESMRNIYANLQNNFSIPIWGTRNPKRLLLALYNQSTFLKKKRYERLFKKWYSKYDLKNSKYFSISQWSWYGDVHLTEDIRKVVYLKFGTMELPAPIGYDAILKRMYGDYMALPPVEKQKSHHEHDGVYLL